MRVSAQLGAQWSHSRAQEVGLEQMSQEAGLLRQERRHRL